MGRRKRAPYPPARNNVLSRARIARRYAERDNAVHIQRALVRPEFLAVIMVLGAFAMAVALAIGLPHMIGETRRAVAILFPS